MIFFFFLTFLPICPSQTFFRENDAVCPPRTSLTGILLRWMDLTAMGSNEPSGSGPNSRMSFSRINPRNVVPETTVPTPCAKERSKQLWSFKWKLDPVVTDLNLKPLFFLLLYTHTQFFLVSVNIISYRYRVGVVDLELRGLVRLTGRPGRQQVQEHLQ